MPCRRYIYIYKVPLPPPNIDDYNDEYTKAVTTVTTATKTAATNRINGINKAITTKGRSEQAPLGSKQKLPIINRKHGKHKEQQRQPTIFSSFIKSSINSSYLSRNQQHHDYHQMHLYRKSIIVMLLIIIRAPLTIHNIGSKKSISYRNKIINKRQLQIVKLNGRIKMKLGVK